MFLRAAIMSSLIFVETVGLFGVVCAQTVTSHTDTAMAAIAANTKVIKALEALKNDDDRTLEEQKQIAQISAPPFKERPRSEYMLKRFIELGLSDAAIDGEGNVIARRKGLS